MREALQQACAAYGCPEHIRSDNGLEYIAETIREWITEEKIQTLYIEPGCPW